MRAELAAALDQAGAGRQAELLAAAWARRFAALVSSIRRGAPWRSADDLHAEALAQVLRDGPQLAEATVQHLVLAGHRLRPWPDAQEALRHLARQFTVVALSNGNLSMLTDLFAAAGLTCTACCPAKWCTPTSRTPPSTGWRWTGWRSIHAGRSWSLPTPGTCALPPPMGCAPRISNARGKALRNRQTHSTSPRRTWLPSPRACLPRCEAPQTASPRDAARPGRTRRPAGRARARLRVRCSAAVFTRKFWSRSPERGLMDDSTAKPSRRICLAACSLKAGGLFSKGSGRFTIGPKVISRPGGRLPFGRLAAPFAGQGIWLQPY